MNDKMKFGLIGLMLGAVVMGFVVFMVVGPSSVKTATTSTKQEGNSDILDAHFIEQMIPHHEDAITMAKLAQTKAQRPEVKQLADNIIESQGKEIEQMKEWYKSWFGKELPTGREIMNQHGMMGNGGMHMGMMGDQSDEDRLANAEDFDTVFVQEMIPHHQMAVMMASMLKEGTTRPEMKKLADDIINAQTNEIDQMRAWLKEGNK